MNRRTKIVATLGPSSRTPEALGALLDAGVNVVRINCSHSSAEGIREMVARTRRLSTQKQLPIGILLDLQGPKIRTGDLDAPIELGGGDVLTVVMDDQYVAQPPTAQHVHSASLHGQRGIPAHKNAGSASAFTVASGRGSVSPAATTVAW